MLWSRNTGKYRPLFSYYLDNSKNRLNLTYVVYVTGNLMEMEVQYCEINQNLFLSLILNAENVKLKAAVITKKRR